MNSRRYFWPLAAAAVSIVVSGCALPPIVTAVSLGADFMSLAGTGKTVTDHGISLVMDQDCALLRGLDGEVCQDFAPSEDTPEGALIALAPISDPVFDPTARDTLALPASAPSLRDSLELALAGTPAGERDVPLASFASLPGGIAGYDGFRYLTADIKG